MSPQPFHREVTQAPPTTRLRNYHARGVQVDHLSLFHRMATFLPDESKSKIENFFHRELLFDRREEIGPGLVPLAWLDR